MERPDDYEAITTLDISDKKLKELPSWVSECKNLEILDCSRNNITHLDNLPPNLKKLYCHDNKITHLDNLPQRLKELECSNNPLKYTFKTILFFGRLFPVTFYFTYSRKWKDHMIMNQ